MRMTKQQFCDAIETYQSMMEQYDEVAEVLNIGPETIFDSWIDNYYILIQNLCELEENEIYGTDLDWFVFETDYGRREDMNKIYLDDGRVWTINSPEILYDFITREE